MERELRDFILEHQLSAFPAAVSSPSFPEGAKNLIQCHGIGTLRANTVMLGWSDEKDHREDFGTLLRMIANLKRSILVVNARDELLDPHHLPEGTVDVWWRGQSHGPLMLLLAHLLCQTREWGLRSIRLIRVIGTRSEADEARARLEQLIRDARIEAEAHVVVTDSFEQALVTESRNAALVFLGFQPPRSGEEIRFMERYRQMLEPLPSTILVHSEGSARLEA
jgi:hypothetical protein